MTHSFEVELAVKYGFEAAVIINYLHFWICKNEANGKHFHDGRYWTYNSLAAFAKLFPYITKRKIEIALTALKKDGLIMTGNFNEEPFDKTMWYTFTDEGKSLINGLYSHVAETDTSMSRNEYIDVTKSTHRCDDMVTTIPVNKNYTVNENITVNEITNNNVGKPDSPIIGEVIAYLNERTGSHYRATTESTKRHIRARINDGYKLEDFKQVIDTKASQWLKDERMRIYLRPETLFGSKFEAYLNEGNTKKPVMEYADADDFFKSWRD